MEPSLTCQMVAKAVKNTRLGMLAEDLAHAKSALDIVKMSLSVSYIHIFNILLNTCIYKSVLFIIIAK